MGKGEGGGILVSFEVWISEENVITFIYIYSIVVNTLPWELSIYLSIYLFIYLVYPIYYGCDPSKVDFLA